MTTKLFLSVGRGLLGAVLLAVLAMGCGSGAILEKEKLDQVSRVAVVGFSIQERLPNTGKGVMKSILSGDSEAPGGMNLHAAEIAKVSQHADDGLLELKRALEKRFSWKVLAGADLSATTAYKKFAAQKTQQPQARPMLSGKNKAVFVPQHAVETFLIRDLAPAERNELARELGVDALLLVNYDVDLVRGGGLEQLVGAGNFKSRAIVEVSLLSPGQEGPIWRDSVVGANTQEKVEHALGFASEEATHAQALSAMRLATQQLLSKVQ